MKMNDEGTVLIAKSIPNLDYDYYGNRGVMLVYTGSANTEWKLKNSLTGQLWNNYQNTQYTYTSMNNDGTVLMFGQEINTNPSWCSPTEGVVSVFTGSKNEGWAFKQLIKPKDRNPIHFDMNLFCNSDGSILGMGGTEAFSASQSDNLGEFSIFTGSKTNGWGLAWSIRPSSPYDVNPKSCNSSAINNDGSVVIMGSNQLKINSFGADPITSLVPNDVYKYDNSLFP
jgi:hypothetical protein